MNNDTIFFHHSTAVSYFRLILKCFAYGPKGYTSAIAFFNEVSPVGLILSFDYIQVSFFLPFPFHFLGYFIFPSLLSHLVGRGMPLQYKLMRQNQMFDKLVLRIT